MDKDKVRSIKPCSKGYGLRFKILMCQNAHGSLEDSLLHSYALPSHKGNMFGCLQVGIFFFVIENRMSKNIRCHVFGKFYNLITFIIRLCLFSKSKYTICINKFRKIKIKCNICTRYFRVLLTVSRFNS